MIQSKKESLEQWLCVLPPESDHLRDQRSLGPKCPGVFFYPGTATQVKPSAPVQDFKREEETAHLPQLSRFFFQPETPSATFCSQIYMQEISCR